jgi:CRP/FNR family transcriptional regulator
MVMEGLIRGYVVAEDGREATVRYMRPGDPVAIAAPLLERWPCSLQALAPTTVLYFDERQFEAALGSDVALAHRVAESLARALESSAHTMRGLAFGRVRQRVAEHLISLADRDSRGRLVANVTQEGLADAVGSVRDVVARRLADLVESGVVGTSHGRVEIFNEEALRQEATIR